MFKSLEAKNFKVFDNLILENLSKVNLITGVNNVGKTALLEAIFLLSGCGNIGLVSKINSFRGVSQFSGEPNKIREALWRPLFRNLNSDLAISIKGILEDESSINAQIVSERGLYIVSPSPSPETSSIEPTSDISNDIGERLSYTFSHNGEEVGRYEMIVDEQGPRVEPPPPPPFFRGFFIPSRSISSPKEEAELFSSLEVVGEINKLLPTIQLLEPRLKRLAVLVNAGTPMIHGDIGIGRLIPIPFMGDGLRRMTQILLTIGNSPGGIVIIDDIEFGIHHSNINRIWRSLFDASSRYNTQIFLTTHSYEWIRGASQIVKESFVSDLSLFRLEMQNSHVDVIRYDQDTLKSAVKAELEIR